MSTVLSQFGHQIEALGTVAKLNPGHAFGDVISRT